MAAGIGIDGMLGIAGSGGIMLGNEMLGTPGNANPPIVIAGDGIGIAGMLGIAGVGIAIAGRAIVGHPGSGGRSTDRDGTANGTGGIGIDGITSTGGTIAGSPGIAKLHLLTVHNPLMYWVLHRSNADTRPNSAACSPIS